MKFYIIAGEASGDLHASNLVKALKQLHSAAQFRGFGGDLMKAAGVELVKHYRETAYMGFWEVIKNLRKILGFIDLCKKDILGWKPDALILVDYPGFNLRIAEFARQQGFSGMNSSHKVFYYISPQVWAWKSSRVKKIRRDVDRMFVILPFEKDFYRKWNYDVEFVGHPLLDALPYFSPQTSTVPMPDNKPIIALLPGSRKQEIASILPAMLQIIPAFPGYQFTIGAVSTVEEKFYRAMIGNTTCELSFDKTYLLLSRAKAALVASGTATMETALFNVPQVVCYKGSGLSFFIAKRLVDVKFIAMVNLILDRPLVKELIQKELNASNLKSELQKILFDETRRKEIEEGYKELKEKLGGAGASMKTATQILNIMSSNKP